MDYIKQQFRKDVSKRVIVFPQILLRCVNLWPERRNGFTVVMFWIMLVAMLVLETGQLIYFALNIKDVAAIAAIMSTLSTTFQAICKSSVLFVHSKRLKSVIETIRNDFWASNCLGFETEQALLFDGRLALSSMIMVLASALVFASGFLSAPLREGTRSLPFLSWYPFNWQISPWYEIIYALQCFVNVYVIIVSICGHDDLFLALCTNCIGQFKMLKQAMAKIGTEDGIKLIRSLKGEYCRCRIRGDLEERELLVKCVQHHRKLIRIYDDIDVVFAASNLVQLLCSAIAICVSSFLIVMIGKDQIVPLISYCLGHVLQLFIFCAAANELAYQSQSLSTYALSGGWYKKKYLDLKRDLIMVVLVSQKPKKISALGVVDLNFATFIAVLRLSFSFYTFLSTIVRK